MVVSVDAGRESVRAYVIEQASLGLEHVIALVRAEADAILAQVEDLTEAEGSASPAQDQFSALQVLQHLNGSFERSIDRLRTLSSGQSWSPTGPGAGPGSIPDDATPSFVEARRQFATGTDAVLAVLRIADPARGLDLTVSHPGFGDFNWLQWAIYSHQVHTHDHVGQLGQIRAQVHKLRPMTQSRFPPVALPETAVARDVQTYCLALDGAWEDYPWGDIVYKVGKKMFAAMGGEPLSVTLKATPDDAEVLTQSPNITKARYVGKYGWVTVTVVDDAMLDLTRDLISASYALIAPKRRRPASARPK